MSDGGQERGGKDGWGGLWCGVVWLGGRGGRMTTLWPCLPVSQTHAGQEPNHEPRPPRVKKKKERKESFGVARQLCDKSWRASWDVRKKQELTLIKEQPSVVPF